MTQLPSFLDAIRRLTVEVTGTEPDEVSVSEDGSTVTVTSSDGTVDTCKTSDYLRGLATFMDAATDGE